MGGWAREGNGVRRPHVQQFHCLLTLVAVLTTLITRESKRRQGAGGMLVEWGVQRALRDDCPAFMEATAAGAPLYAKFGFRKIGEQTLRLEEFGLDDVPLARMAANLPDHRTVGR